jgi:starch-binding outer membrane protein, SusD/RagB family
MKKYLIAISFIFFAIVFLNGCKKNFLEKYPLDHISSNTFWNSASDLENYNNGLYNLALNDTRNWILVGYNTSGFASFTMSSWALEFPTDNEAPTNKRTLLWQQVRSGTQIVPVNNGTGGWYWDFLRSCNFFLENYQRAQVSDDIKNKYAGEVKLFRALFYADKVRRYGDVPWINKTLNTSSPELYAPRDPREMVMDSVLSDLNFAIANLPEKWNDDSPGRLNKWCALFAKSRICLFEGTWRKYRGLPNATSWITEAANAAKDIMDNGPFHLYSTGNPTQDYRYLFTQADLTGNPEIIFWRRYLLTIIDTNLSYFDAYNGGASRDFAEDYLCTDGLPINQSPLYKGDDSVELTFINRDPRMRQTLLYPPDQPIIQVGGGDTRRQPILRGMSGDAENTGWTIIKIYDAKTYNAGTDAAQAAPVYRYAEVLLNYAEAKAELGTITQSDLDLSINKLRDRVGMPHMDMNNIVVDPRYTGDGVSPLIAEIRRERRIELFNEGLRYYDLMRWKQGKKLLKPTMGMAWDAAAMTRYPQASVQSTFDPIRGKSYIDVYKGTSFAVPVFDENKNYLWPLPINVISQNPNLTQTPGW